MPIIFLTGCAYPVAYEIMGHRLVFSLLGHLSMLEVEKMTQVDPSYSRPSVGLYTALAIPIAVYAVYYCILFPLLRTDLRVIPGPFLAKLTNLHRVLLVRSGVVHEHHIDLHRRHGPLVRLGPNNVSVGSPAAVPVLYNIRTRYPKSDFYPVMGNMANGKVVPTIFSTPDESVHEVMKRPIAQVYAMSNLKSYEPLVESTEALFIEKLERLADEKQPFDLGTWLHWFATDVILEITFGQRLGFLEREQDVDGILQMIEERFWYVAIVGQVPWLDRLLHKNGLMSYLKGLFSTSTVSPVLEFALDQIATRKAERLHHPETKATRRDFLARFLDIKEANPNIPDIWILSWCQQNVQAGSDSTAITLTSVMYHLLRYPDSMELLMKELKEAHLAHPILWEYVHKLPYLDACIKEALRITPAVGIPLERVAPEGGVHLCGRYFAPGTVLGINAWVVHRDKGVYGDDADSWNPGRWMTADEDRRKLMDRTLFSFGGGTRVCLGRNISYLEMYKVIPELLLRFKFDLASPQKQWEIRNAFFTYTKGVMVTVKKVHQE
ncbi:pisatin demethylase [Penicillium chermesinum]|uniref:Pisatin demethylase n=1 Tax=Penicillium chermesinum TaxID=63820 RepID=A0A9W9PGE4_9EURO|nr:pisatin demethylase [Penicillium chermesinum]KAJ5245807.1 pisatin demethylase [Penicillium chermesinum]KAJ6144107.1 pisatin demethylase [Penicillium chermesinum]